MLNGLACPCVVEMCSFPLIPLSLIPIVCPSLPLSRRPAPSVHPWSNYCLPSFPHHLPGCQHSHALHWTTHPAALAARQQNSPDEREGTKEPRRPLVGLEGHNLGPKSGPATHLSLISQLKEEYRKRKGINVTHWEQEQGGASSPTPHLRHSLLVLK